ncbi:hypothetical protein C8J57DRAFT_1510324 [Mycena rebaudengoi]|nr:hypothetical protein C8J57DRAFT_1510324 [Mycena rebaudengoi]
MLFFVGYPSTAEHFQILHDYVRGLPVCPDAKTPVQVNALVSIASFWENTFYGVLYGYAPEVFPTPRRGTGDALAAASARVTGLFAPIIAVYSNAGKTPNGPVYASAVIFVFTGLTIFGLPIETVGVIA